MKTVSERFEELVKIATTSSEKEDIWYTFWIKTVQLVKNLVKISMLEKWKIELRYLREIFQIERV